MDYTREDFTQSGQHYDLILAANSYHSIFDYRRALSQDGIYVMAGGGLSQSLQATLLGPFLITDAEFLLLHPSIAESP
jgi:hypothetical protein